MKITLRLLLTLAVVLAFAAPVRAQLLPAGGPRRYVEFEIKESAADFLKSRQELDSLKELVKEIAKDPSKLPINLERLKQQKIDDKQKKALADWLASDRKLREELRALTKKKPPEQATAKAKDFQKQLGKILDKAEERKDAPPSPDQAPDRPQGAEPVKSDDESLGKLAERAMKRAEATKLGDWLRDSPAWNRAFDDLRTSLNDPRAGRFKGSVWKGKLGGLEGGVWKLGAGALERLKELPRPNLGRIKIAGPKLGNLPAPNLTLPRLPDISGPSLPTYSTWVIWLLLLLFFLLAAWQMRRWSKRAAERAAELARLGPWPVDPEAVATRTDLIRAFDYLALLTLGLAVQSWNHHAVVRLWGKRAPLLAQPAQALALLYEQARYTDGTDDLSDAQRDLARQSLLQLKEAL